MRLSLSLESSIGGGKSGSAVGRAQGKGVGGGYTRVTGVKGPPSLRVFSATGRPSPRRPLSSSISSAFARLSVIKRPISVSSASQTAVRAYAVGQSSSSSFMAAAAVGSDGSAYRGRRVRSATMKSWDAKRANSRVVWSEIGCLRTRVKRFAHAGSPVIKGSSLAFCYSPARSMPSSSLDSFRSSPGSAVAFFAAHRGRDELLVVVVAPSRRRRKGLVAARSFVAAAAFLRASLSSPSRVDPVVRGDKKRGG